MNIESRLNKIEEYVAGMGNRKQAFSIMKRLSSLPPQADHASLLVELWELNNNKVM